MLFEGGRRSITISLGEREYVINRARLDEWLVLEQLRLDKNVRGYLEHYGIDCSGPGLNLLRAFVAILRLNSITIDLPILRKYVIEKKQPELSWDYPKRWMASWIHIVAYGYHWSRREILRLDIDEFFSYVQEIVVEKQLEREWAYSLTELAYPIDTDGKTRKYKPLERPPWMQAPKHLIKPLQIPPDLAPQGLVYYPSSKHLSSSS